ncbi:hypothetical protein J7384_05970 [Endozoicomonas sp. G2_1]|uniref:hypothetical protein n=1 Tax=Endozoicomonas sp. G2_1 TaxID=2821091 RepID=UPI001ADD2EE3|nr:hypothetical protein [Endozoicomonas sp. G2_1]MBO9489904.1 hypothetical protein [Endozoicomonas sp. G2_1]
MMLNALHKLALLLAPLRKAWLVLAISSLASLAFILVSGFNANSEGYLLPLLALSLWSLLAYIIASTFVQLPETVNNKQGFFTRLKLKLQRLFYWLLGILFIGLTATTLLFTLRLLNIWRLQ